LSISGNNGNSVEEPITRSNSSIDPNQIQKIALENIEIAETTVRQFKSFSEEYPKYLALDYLISSAKELNETMKELEIYLQQNDIVIPPKQLLDIENKQDKSRVLCTLLSATQLRVLQFLKLICQKLPSMNPKTAETSTQKIIDVVKKHF